MTEQLSHGRRVVRTEHVYSVVRPEDLRSMREYNIRQYLHHKKEMFKILEAGQYIAANKPRRALEKYAKLVLDAKKADKPTQFEIDNRARIKARIFDELQVLHGRV